MKQFGVFVLILPAIMRSQLTQTLVDLLAARTATFPQMLWDGKLLEGPWAGRPALFSPGLLLGAGLPEAGKDTVVSPASIFE